MIACGPAARQRPSAEALPLADIAPSALGQAHYKLPPRLRLMEAFPATVSGMTVGFRVTAARDLAAG